MDTLKHIFVTSVPEELEEGTLYVSMVYATVIHNCCCGCGREIVTPLSPTDWQLTFDGETITLFPSIGNWSSECKSHYWIKKSKVKWARQWSDEEIAAGRFQDRLNKETYYSQNKSASAFKETKPFGSKESQKKSAIGPLKRIKNWWANKWVKNK